MTTQESINTYKEQIEIAEEGKKKAEKRVLTETKYRYSNLEEFRALLKELRSSLLWYEKRKEYETR